MAFTETNEEKTEGFSARWGSDGISRMTGYQHRICRSVDLHVQLIRFYKVFALKSEPVSDRKRLVISMSLLVFYGSRFDATAGANLDANQQHHLLLYSESVGVVSTD